VDVLKVQREQNAISSLSMQDGAARGRKIRQLNCRNKDGSPDNDSGKALDKLRNFVEAAGDPEKACAFPVRADESQDLR